MLTTPSPLASPSKKLKTGIDVGCGDTLLETVKYAEQASTVAS